MNGVETECEEKGGGGKFLFFCYFYYITRWNAIKMELMLECVFQKDRQGYYFIVMVVVIKIQIFCSTQQIFPIVLFTGGNWKKRENIFERGNTGSRSIFISCDFYNNFHGWDGLSYSQLYRDFISLITASLFMQIVNRGGKSRQKYRKSTFLCLSL